MSLCVRAHKIEICTPTTSYGHLDMYPWNLLSQALGQVIEKGDNDTPLIILDFSENGYNNVPWYLISQHIGTQFDIRSMNEENRNS